MGPKDAEITKTPLIPDKVGVSKAIHVSAQGAPSFVLLFHPRVWFMATIHPLHPIRIRHVSHKMGLANAG
jgi:hypothetical protein